MGYTKKDKVLYYLILPHKDSEDDNNNTGGEIPMPEETFLVEFNSTEYESESFDELKEYIIINFPPGSYDVYKILEDGSKEFYATITFTSNEKDNY